MSDAAAPRLLVVRLGSLGDLVHTLPAVAALHRARPDTAIDWLVDRVHRDFLELVPAIASIVTLDRPTLAGWRDVRRRLRAQRYEAALDFQGLLKSAALARLSGAARVAGFDRAALRERAAAWLYTERIDVGEGRHVIDKNLALAAAFGAATMPREFPLAPVTSAALETLRAQGIDRFALINCGAAWPNKRWPADRFGQVAAWLREHRGLRSVALWGPGEARLASEVVRLSGGAATAAPATGLRDLVALSRAASLMVSGDTGPTHIAGAVGTPIVAIFGPTDPSRNGPWDADDRVVSRYGACDCHYQRVCHRSSDRWCLLDVSVEDVRRAIDERLAAAARAAC
ncbi:MAG TPA: glycosyltransferase family 9 protein [Vicinamibacterales bacterium]|jgi:lipopolysaccharide heptosyltransferase I|nr:glycosyltransferase family 9 protein [Vicinamibacterales bacterium]